MHSPPTAAGGTQKKRWRSLLICTLLYYYSRNRLDFTLYNFSLSLSPLHHLPLPFQGWATALFSIVPYNFLPTPHLLPSPSSLLSALPCLSLLVCRRESKHWKAFAYCLSRTGRDNYQSIKVNEISRYADEQGIGSLILWRVSNFMSPWVVMGWCLKKWMIALFHASKKTPQSR